MKRRKFIRNLGMGAAVIAATGVAGCSNEKAEQESTQTTPPKPEGIQKYTEIGSTGLKMSDISMGCGGLDNPYIVERALDLGVNYFDTAPDYQNGQSEIALGKVLKDPAKRDKAIICTKFCERGAYGLHLDFGSPEEDFIRAVEGSLQRLNTDRIDFIMVHAIGERENDRPRLTDPPMLAAVEKLKEQGKVLHLNVSSHGPHCMEDCLLEAIESGYFASFMPALNFMRYERLGEVLTKAEEENVGVVAMKTLAGAKEEDLSRFQEGDTDLAQAAFKWVFTQPGISGLVVTMKTTADVEKYVAASGKRFTEEDQVLLDRYSTDVRRQYCRTGCGDCLTSCPHEVAIADVMRLDMYFTAYGDHLKALQGYHRLPHKMKPTLCATCSGPCTSACGFGLPVKERLLDASRRLQLA
jgi:aryl-alcohol dehydrogenase-like predicted oxidoreductase